jgi:Dolichyl-phosphate-mannose-protein mannosyltransferase
MSKSPKLSEQVEKCHLTRSVIKIMLLGGSMQETKFRHFLSHTVLSIFVITALLVALRAPLLDIPFERDEGEYAYIAWRLEHCELPYRDWFDQKPPAIFWVYRLALSLPFDPIRSVHLTGSVFALASAIGIFFLARRMVGKSWGTAAALLYVVLAADPLIQGTAANTELFMLLPVIVGNWMYYHSVCDRRRGVALMFAVGMANQGL